MESAFIPWKKYFLYFLFFVILLSVYQWISNPLVITVVGNSSVTAQAESAVVTFTLTNNADNPDSALANLKTNITKLKDNLKSMSVQESNLYESQASVVPASTISASATGFQATATMGVKTEKVSDISSIVSMLYSSGAVVVSQPVLTAKDAEKEDKLAYDQALKDAKSKANKIAISNWKLIKKIVLIQESQQQSTSTVTTKADVATQVTDNISPDQGFIKINKAVSVSYKLW